MMKRLFSHIIIFSATLLILHSCSVGPDFQQVETVANESYRYDSLKTATIVNLLWWELFDDPVLDSLIVIALRENKDVLVAAKRIEESRAILGFQKGEYGPKFNVAGNVTGGNFVGQKFENTQSGFSGGLTMTWEIDIWGKYRRLSESARAELLGSEYNKRNIEISLISDVAQTYFVLLDFLWRYDVSLKTVASRQTGLEIIQARFDSGIIPEIDLNQAQIQLAISAAAVPFFRRQIGFTENALQILLGRNPNSVSIGKPLNEQAIPKQIPPGLPSTLLARRPDVAQAEQQIVSQNAQVGAAVAMRFPSLSITGFLGIASNSLTNFNKGFGGFAWNAGGGLLAPLFYWQQNKRRVQIEKFRTEQIILQYEQTVLQAFREVEDALIAITTLKEELIATQNRVTAAVNAEYLSQARYDRGATSYLEVLENQRQAFDSQLAYASNLRELLSSYFELYKALGGGWLSAKEMQNAQEGN